MAIRGGGGDCPRAPVPSGRFPSSCCLGFRGDAAPQAAGVTGDSEIAQQKAPSTVAREDGGSLGVQSETLDIY